MRPLKKIILSIPILLMAIHGYSGPGDKFDKKLYKKEGDEAFKGGNIYAAEDIYTKILEHDSTETSVYYNLAECYFMARDYEKSAIWFTKAYKADAVKNASSLYYAALSIKMQG